MAGYFGIDGDHAREFGVAVGEALGDFVGEDDDVVGDAEGAEGAELGEGKDFAEGIVAAGWEDIQVKGLGTSLDEKALTWN